MSPDKQRIAIAEWCGWHGIQDGIRGLVGMLGPLRGYQRIPDYPNDLNAMHEAESRLTVGQIPVWFEHLRKICPAGTYGPYDSAFWITHATAAQRAEALLRTIGKWEE